MRPSSASGLPRVRVSFPGGGGGPGSKFGSRPWAAALLLGGMLLLLGYAHVAGRLQLRQLLNASFSSSSHAARPPSTASFNTTAPGSSSSWSKAAASWVPLSTITASVTAGSSSISNVSGAAAAAAAAAAGGADVERLQRLQQGIDVGDGSDSALLGALVGVGSMRNTSAALNAHPLVHGRVTKAGMTDPSAWLSNFTDARLDSFLSWRINRARAGGPAADPATCAAADHPPLPFPGCHVFVNHEYKYIYVRSPKAASTSIVNMLGECDNLRTRGHNASSCMALHFYWPHASLAPERLAATWQDYFVFGFVRNPWRRAYSLYKYIHSSACMSREALKDAGCRVPWPEFCTDPWSATEALHDRGCMTRSKSYLYYHMTDQYHCLRTADGRWAVDFVGRVDEPSDDWQQVLQTLNANRLPGVPELPLAPLEQANARRGGESDPYSAASPAQAQCFDAVSRWYACDVERFGFGAASTVKGESSSNGQQPVAGGPPQPS